MPVSYFTTKPFENWSRGGVQMTGTVFLHLDHSAPVDLMRDQLQRHPARVPGLGRPRLRSGGHRHHPAHHRGARRGHGEGRGRRLDGPRRRPRTDDPLAGRPPPLRPAPRQHGRRGPPTELPPQRQRRPPPEDDPRPSGGAGRSGPGRALGEPIRRHRRSVSSTRHRTRPAWSGTPARPNRTARRGLPSAPGTRPGTTPRRPAPPVQRTGSRRRRSSRVRRHPTPVPPHGSPRCPSRRAPCGPTPHHNDSPHLPPASRCRSTRSTTSGSAPASAPRGQHLVPQPLDDISPGSAASA